MSEDGATRGALRDGEHTHRGEPQPLDRCLRGLYPEASWKKVRRAIESGKVQVDGETAVNVRKLVAPDAVISVKMATPRRSGQPRLDASAIVLLDSQVVVVDKPAGMLSVPPNHDSRGTLAQLLARRLRRRGARPVSLGIVQRLDRDTSGLLVFARSNDARDHLKEQFKQRSVERGYLALVAGEARAGTIRSRLVEERDGQRRSTRDPTRGVEAVTHVRVCERLQGATLIACRLETGRTHQIRIHLSESGHPLLGERRYTRMGVTAPEAPRIMLHANMLGFVHPLSDEPLHFDAPMPPDMQRLVEQLKLEQHG